MKVNDYIYVNDKLCQYFNTLICFANIVCNKLTTLSEKREREKETYNK